MSIRLLGSVCLPISSSGWKVEEACFLVSENRTRNLLGLDLQDQLGVVTTQLRAEHFQQLEVKDQDPTSDYWSSFFAKKYAHVFNRLGRSKNHKVFTNFKYPLVPRQVKGRKVPIHIQDRVANEIKQLVRQGHIEKLDKCTTDYFIAPIVLTAKKDGSIKLALNAKPMNAQIWKNKYQMPNIHELIDSVAQIITNDVPGTVWFTSLDLKYAFSQLPLSSVSSSHCNFNILCGDATGTYRFRTRFYGLTDMPNEFQKAMGCTMQGLEGVICYLYDILVFTKGDVQEHNNLVERVMQRLDAEGWALKFSKCEFSVNQLTCLGYVINESGYSPKFSKIDAIHSLKPPKTLKQLRSFMGTLNHLQRFIPDLHTYTVHFRESLRACNKQSFRWGEEQDNAFKSINNLLANIPNLFHYDSSKKFRLKCDASHNGLGACLEQEIEPGVWAPTAFASRFLKHAEIKYSTIELELLAIVSACEQFRTYLLGNRFQVLTDHKAIISALSENYNNKSYQSRLSRWADRLLPFDFEVIDVPGVTLGIVDYLSRHPTLSAPAPSIYDELFVVKSIEAFNSAFSFINSFNIIDSARKLCSPSQEVAAPQTQKSNCFLDQSNYVMQIRAYSLSPSEGVKSCCSSVDQSETGMLINNRRPDLLALNHCLRPESLKDSCNSSFSSLFHSTKSLSFNSSNNSNMNPSHSTVLPHTGDKPPTQQAHPTELPPSHSSMEEQADLLSFVENFTLSSPNFRRPNPRPPVRSRQVGRISRRDQVRQRNRTRERAAKTRFVAARTASRREGHNQLLEAMRKCRLSRQGRIHTADKVGVYAINGRNPIISKSKKKIVGLPGLFDADLLAELTEEDRFLGPMKRAINSKDVSSFNKL